MGPLSGKTVLITGAKGGLGTFVTQAFLDAGANVFGVSRSIQPQDFPHDRFIAMQSELHNKESATLALDLLPKIDVAIHLVGGWAGGKTVQETDSAELDRMFDVNLRSAFVLAQAVLPRMRSQASGRFLAIASRSAVEPTANSGAYNAAKAALISLVRTIAVENRDFGITANVVLPGTMNTPANRAAMPTADQSRWVDPAHVAGLLVHLASDQATSINGAVIPIYGGAA